METSLFEYGVMWKLQHDNDNMKYGNCSFYISFDYHDSNGSGKGEINPKGNSIYNSK